MLICTIFFALLKATNTGLIAGWTLGPFLSSLPSRNCSTLEGFRAYLSALRPSLPRILAFYGSPKWRNAAFRCYYLRQKLLHDVCHQFRMTGKRTVVFFGASRYLGDRMDANEPFCRG